ncbi:hypothetical protein QE152_g37263 [Popillia japonica]|uniref:Uncharacterized protein n=1 Tax=Popillia japonica TaxID=7064 RepID=A0AAW1IAY6_POPJA
MPPDTRQKSDKGDENIVINFLRGSKFGELIKSIVTKVINKEMKTIHDRINQLELKITTPNKNIVRNMSIQDNIQTRSKQDDRRRRKMPIIYGSSDDNCTIKAATRYVY